MLLSGDSIQAQSSATDTLLVAPKAKPVITPAQVLSWLPKDATPAQQDSAIQKHLKIAEIHWSEQPDTLHLPGHTAEQVKNARQVPIYYKESFFSESAYAQPEMQTGRMGVAGDPVPYTIAGDNLLTSLLIGCFILALVAFSKTREFIYRNIKNFFHIQHGTTTEITETSAELRFQFFLVVQTCLLLAILMFNYTKEWIDDSFIFEQYQIIGIYAAATACYFLIKALLYEMVHLTFFTAKESEQWMKSFILLVSAEGVLLFPLVMLQAYFNMGMASSTIYVFLVVLIVKILTFFKSYIIFFHRKTIHLSIILYFCALEIVPLLLLVGGVQIMNDYLMVN